MKHLKSLLAVLMFTLYWAGTTKPMLQGEKARITSGEHKGKKVIINYTWENGCVDVRYGLLGISHYYITDYHRLKRVK